MGDEDDGHAELALQFGVLGLISVLLNTAADVAVSFAAGSVRAGMAGNPSLVHRLREASGGAMIALGIGLLMAERPAR